MGEKNVKLGGGEGKETLTSMPTTYTTTHIRMRERERERESIIDNSNNILGV